MRLYLFVDKHGVGRFVTQSMLHSSLQEVYCTGLDSDELQQYTIEGATEADGLFYTTELAGAAGVNVWLFREPEMTDAQVTRAKLIMRLNRDVVHLYVVKLKRILK